jgi:hypothetical protein
VQRNCTLSRTARFLTRSVSFWPRATIGYLNLRASAIAGVRACVRAHDGPRGRPVPLRVVVFGLLFLPAVRCAACCLWLLVGAIVSAPHDGPRQRRRSDRNRSGSGGAREAEQQCSQYRCS